MNGSRWLTFSKRERNGMLAILILITIVYSLPYWYEVFKGENAAVSVRQFNAYLRNIKSPDSSFSNNETRFRFRSNEYPSGSNYTNHSSADNPHVEQRSNMRNSSSHSNAQNNPSYAGNYSSYAQRNISYVSNHINKTQRNGNYTNKHRNTIPFASININTASAEQFQQLPGIGPVLSARMINFREKIGGFKSLDQFAKTYGLSDSVFVSIKPFLMIQPVFESNNHAKINNRTESNSTAKSLTPRNTTKINLNEAILQDFSHHPAIKYTLARQLLAFKQQHGPFKAIDDLKYMIGIDSETLKILDDYLTFSNE